MMGRASTTRASARARNIMAQSRGIKWEETPWMVRLEPVYIIDKI